MLTVSALISDPVKAGHAAQKLRTSGVAPAGIRTVTKDPAAARAVAERAAGERTTSTVVGALLGLLIGAALGWMIGGIRDPLAPPGPNAQTIQMVMALVGLGVGVIVGLIAGWLVGTLARRNRVASYVEAVEAGDTLLIAEIAEDQLREVESLLGSYGARGVRAIPSQAAAPLERTADS
jgi:hypothetical protein